MALMMLDEFFDYKNRLMEMLCNNPDAVHLVTDCSTADVPNYDLPYTQIFPYEFIPETVSEGQTFICFDVDITKVYNKTFYQPVIYIWVFTHKSKFRLPDGGVRLDQLASVINEQLNGSRFYGLGTLELHSVERFVPILDYNGRVLTFTTKDYNRLSPSNKAVPSNRKDRPVYPSNSNANAGTTDPVDPSDPSDPGDGGSDNGGGGVNP